MKELSIKELIKGNFVTFDSLRQGFAYYNLWVKIPNSEQTKFITESSHDRYQFVIPLDDIGNGTLKYSMKAIEVMRWIRKALENKELIKQNEPSRKTETIA